jgi:hypothetical protein
MRFSVRGRRIEIIVDRVIGAFRNAAAGAAFDADCRREAADDAGGCGLLNADARGYVERCRQSVCSENKSSAHAERGYACGCGESCDSRPGFSVHALFFYVPCYMQTILNSFAFVKFIGINIYMRVLNVPFISQLRLIMV